MDNFRMKQAQDLILKSTKKPKNTDTFHDAESGFIDAKLSESALKNIIKSEDFIYKSLPNHHLSKKEAKNYTNYLIAARENIDEQLMNFKIIERQIDEIDINQITEDILFITSKNNFKKILKNLGVDVKRIIVADTPLLIEDMKIINPKIPDSALKGIEKKIDHIHNDIKRKTSSLNPSKIIVIAENDTNGNLLKERSKEFYNAKTHLADNIKDLDESTLKKIIENS